MKKLLITLLLLLPSLAFATPISWDFAGGILQPLQSAWSAVIKGSYFTATSTTQSSTFPLFTSTNSTTTNATTTNLRTTQLGVGSDYITDLTGTGLSIVGNALTATNDHVAVTVSGARDYITLSGQDIVRGVVDVSDDTNLSGDTEVVLTGDALSLGESLTFTSATATNIASTLSTTSVFYGAGLTDCSSASNALTYVSSTGKFGCNTILGGGGGGGGGWATTTDNNAEIGEIVAYTPYDAYIGGSSSSTASFNFDQDSTLFTIGAPTSVATGSILTQFGVLLFGSSTAETINLDFRTSDVVRLTSSTSVLAFDFGGIKASSTYASTTKLNLYQQLFDTNSQAGSNGQVLTSTGTSTLWKTISVAGDGVSNWLFDGSRLSPSTTVGIGVFASSTISDLNSTNATATNATTTNLAATSFKIGSDVITDITGTNLSVTNGVLNASGGSGGGSISTSSIPVAGNLTYWTSPSTVSDVATGTLTENITGMELSATRGLVGGSAVLSLTNGFTVPTTSSTTEWGSFYQTPSTRITAGTGIDWSGNTLNGVYTAGDGLTLNTEDFDCDIASGSVFGCLASADWTVFNNKVSSTSIDTSSELAALLTDEIGTAQLVFNNPSTFSFGSATSSGSSTIASLTVTNGTTTNSTSTNLAVSGSLKLFGGTTVTSNNALCILLTGGAGLCDGTDDTGAGGSTLKPYSWYVDADGAGDYTTIQGALDQCAVVGGGSIYLTDPYYFIGGTGLVFKSNDCQVIGIYASTTIEVSGATTAFKTNSPAGTYANVGVQNVVIVGDGTAGSVGIDMSDMIRSRYTGIIMDNLDIGFKLDDTQNVTFYNTVRDFAITTIGSYGIYASSTNPTNDNKFSDGFIGCTASCTGIHLNNAQANSFTNVSIEPATTAGTIGVRIDVSNSATNNGTFANKFTNLYAEANGIGISASSTIGTKIVLGNTFDGGEIVANGVDVVDSSNGNGAVQFNGAIVNYEIANMFATTTMTFATTTKLKISGSLFDTNGNTGSSGQVLTSTGTSTLWKTVTGGSGSKWTDGTNFTYLTNTTYDLALGSNATETAPFWWDVSATTSYIGNGGAGDSVLTFGPTGSEWTMGFDDTDDSFRISSSTSLGTFDFFKLFSTTTQLSDTSSLTSLLQNKGYRTVINPNGSGYLGRTDFLDEFVVKGRQRNPDWFISDCPNPVGATTIAADGVTGCDGFSFGEQGTETLTAVAGNGYSYAQLGGAVANESAAFALNGATAGFLNFATSTPSMEVTARIGTIVANSSTTKYVIGYSNAPVAAPGTGAEPSVGCFFIASTTVANWLATCRTALGTGTIVDTGVSSTSIATGAGVWRTFRIDADSDNAKFYIMNGDTGALNLVADISTTYPGTTALNAGLWWHRTTGTQAIQFDFFGLNVQWRRFIPNL